MVPLYRFNCSKDWDITELSFDTKIIYFKWLLMLAPNRLLPWCLEAYTWYTMTAGNLMYHNPKLMPCHKKQKWAERTSMYLWSSWTSTNSSFPCFSSSLAFEIGEKNYMEQKTNKAHPMDSSKKYIYRQKAFPNLYSLSWNRSSHE